MAVYSNVESHKNVRELHKCLMQQEQKDVFSQTYNLPNLSLQYHLYMYQQSSHMLLPKEYKIICATPRAKNECHPCHGWQSKS